MIAALLQTALGDISPIRRTLVAMLAAHRGRLGSAQFVAASLGLRSRHQLRRVLSLEGLPPLGQLIGWTRVLSWIVAWESSGISLCRSAIEDGSDPAACYRLVRRVTGRCWGEVRLLGSAWATLRLRDSARSGESPAVAIDEGAA